MTISIVPLSTATSMDEELSKAFNLLYEECKSMHQRWQEYEELFGGSQARIDLLNRHTGVHFYFVQESLWQSTLLHLCRMTDPAKSMGKSNLSLAHLGTLIRQDMRDEMAKLTKEAEDAALFARDWRNRFYAHRDLGLAQQSSRALESATRIAVETSLQAIGECLNFVHKEYDDTTTSWDPITPLSGAATMLKYLNAGVKSEEARHKRIEEGKATSSDFDFDHI